MPVGWRHRHIGIWRKALRRRTRPSHWRVAASVRRTFDLPGLPRAPRRPGEVWAVMLVKNEADILAATVQHLLGQGVDRVLVVDNGSTDGTLDLVRGFVSEGSVLLGHDREVAYHQSEKLTCLARWATSRGADWVVPVDADEFWFAEDTTLGDHLRRTTDDMVEARLWNLFPVPANPHPTGLDGTLRFDHGSNILVKTAVRAHPLVWIGMGNHQALRPGMTGDGLMVAHLPWRSETQLARKVRQGAVALAAATELADHLGGHWRRQAELTDEQVHAVWQRLLDGEGDEGLGWRPRGPFSLVEAGRWQTWSAPDPAPVTGAQ